jgi:hypothetical protein
VSDAREKQPEKRILDIVRQTYGSSHWRGLVHVSVYSGIKIEDVYARQLTVLLRAEDAQTALGIVGGIAAALELAHDIHRTEVVEIARVSA